MGVDLIWLDAAYVQRGALRDESGLVGSAISRAQNHGSTILISRIDLFGDTRFSSVQAGQLFREFDEIRRASQDVEERIAIGHVLSVLRAVDGAPDEWLEFIGD